MAQKPSIIFVPGAWHTAEAWNKVTALLSSQDYKCVAVTLPSTLSSPTTTLLEDITAVRNAITAETAKGQDVVLVVHSFGGFVGGSAIKGLTRPKEAGSSPTTTGHVIGLAMIATGFVQTNIGFLESFDGQPPPIWKLTPEGFVILAVPARELFYHDLPVAEGEYWVSKLTKQAQLPMTEDGTHAYSGWMDVPVWYLATVEDKAWPFEAQMMTAEMAKAAGGDITIRELASSHSPMLSRPEETAKFVLDAVAAFTQK